MTKWIEESHESEGEEFISDLYIISDIDTSSDIDTMSDINTSFISNTSSLFNTNSLFNTKYDKSNIDKPWNIRRTGKNHKNVSDLIGEYTSKSTSDYSEGRNLDTKYTKKVELTNEQINQLEREFKERKLKHTQANVRALARELKIPIKKSIEHIFSKFSEDAETATREYEVLYEKFTRLKEDIDTSWEKYIKEWTNYKY